MSVDSKKWINLFPIYIITGYLILVIVRVPSIFLEGRFWGEEGTAFFSDAYFDNTLSTLFTPRYGYYGFLQRISAFLAVKVPLEYSPIVTVSISLLIQLLPVILLLYSRIPNMSHSKIKQTMGILLVLFIIPNHEIWLNTINSRFYLLVCTGIILISTPTNKVVKILRYGILLISGLSGIAAVFLTPLFWLRWWYQKTKSNMIESSILSTCAVLQGLIVLMSITIGGNRALAVYPDLWPYIIVIKQIVLPFTGIEYAENCSLYLRPFIGTNTIRYTAIALSFYGLMGFFFVKYRQKESMYLLIAGIISTFISLIGAIENFEYSTMMVHATGMGAGRYYYAPNVFFSLAILIFISFTEFRKRIISTIMSILLVWLVIVGANEYFRKKHCPWLHFGPNWKTEVHLFHNNPDYKLEIWPRPWRISLNKKRVSMQKDNFVINKNEL